MGSTHLIQKRISLLRAMLIGTTIFLWLDVFVHILFRRALRIKGGKWPYHLFRKQSYENISKQQCLRRVYVGYLFKVGLGCMIALIT